MRRERATWDDELPHEFRASRRTAVCWCGRDADDDLHDMPAPDPQRADAGLVREHGSRS
jgi:hypothetical protein